MAELERSHDALRGALIAAGKHIGKFRHNPENEKMLHLLRAKLREARKVRHGTKRRGAAAIA